MAHHVVARIKRRCSTNSRTFNYSHTSTDNVAGSHTSGVADGFAHNRARVIWAGVAILSVGAANEQLTG